MHQIRVAILLFSLITLNQQTLAAEPQWGHLSGRFLYDGEPPPAKSLPIPDHLRHRLAGKDVPDESLVIGEDGGLANVFIWLRPAIGVKPPIHPSYEETEEGSVELVARDLRLQPHAFVLHTSQTLIFRHADEKVGYNLKFDSFSNSPYCGLVPAGQSTNISFEKPERLPIDISCNIHPWIHSRMLVLDHPYGAVTDRQGDSRFAICRRTNGSLSPCMKNPATSSSRKPTADSLNGSGARSSTRSSPATMRWEISSSLRKCSSGMNNEQHPRVLIASSASTLPGNYFSPASNAAHPTSTEDVYYYHGTCSRGIEYGCTRDVRSGAGECGSSVSEITLHAHQPRTSRLQQLRRAA